MGACSTPTYSILHREKPGRMCFVAPNTPHADNCVRSLWQDVHRELLEVRQRFVGAKSFLLMGVHWENYLTIPLRRPTAAVWAAPSL